MLQQLPEALKIPHQNQNPINKQQILNHKNKHSKINKWGLYCNNSIDIQGGSLSILVSGNKADKALMLDGDGTLSYNSAAKLYEGDSAPGLLVKELTLTKGLTKESKGFVKILVSE